jgi:hypothetical protein
VIEQAPAPTKKRPSFILIVIAGVAGFCILCVVASSVMNSLGLVPTRTPTLPPTDAPPPTITNTPPPSETPLPTDTPLPTFTSTPPPEPIVLSGAGDSVVDIQKWDGPALAHIAHNGGGNFAVWNSDANGDHIDLLINTIGAYQGTVPIDFLEREDTHRFEIKAGGAWEIQILPLDMIRKENIPGTVQGTGDEVLSIAGTPDLITANATGSGNFAVWSYGDGRDLVFNEIAPYSGTATLDGDTFILVIKATGPWSIEVTTR